MFYFRLEYSDGTIFDSSNIKLTGWMRISDDSTYTQRFWISEKPEDTKGRITVLRARSGNRGMGEMSVSLEDTDQVGSGSFEVKGDTLVWIIEKEPSKDGRTPGLIETQRYRRSALP